MVTGVVEYTDCRSTAEWDSPSLTVVGITVNCICYILTLDQAVNQRCTCVNKQKKKRKQVGVIKKYRQMLAAVESVGAGRLEWESACRLGTPNVALINTRLSNRSQDAKEVLSGFLKITQRAMVKRRSWVSIAVCLCLHSSLTHHRNINPFKNKVWEIHIFIKKVSSFVHWSS